MRRTKPLFAEIIVGGACFTYALALVLFDNESYLNYVYMFNSLLLVAYIFAKVAASDYSFRLSGAAGQYLIFALFSIGSILWTISGEWTLSRSITILLIAANSMLIYNVVRDFKTTTWIMNGFLFGCLLNVLISFGIISIGWESMEGWRFQGTTTKSNILTNICLFSLVGALYFFAAKRIAVKVYGYFFLLIVLYLIVLTGSKKGLFISIMMLGSYFVFCKHKKTEIPLFFTLVSITVILVLSSSMFSSVLSASDVDVSYLLEKFSNRLTLFFDSIFSSEVVKDQSTEGRIILVGSAYNMWMDHPLIGAGLGAFLAEHGAYAHNNYADLLANLGLLGFLLFYSVYFRIFRAWSRIRHKSNEAILYGIFLVGMLVSEIGTVTYTNKILMFFIIFAAAEIDNALMNSRRAYIERKNA